MTPCFAPRFLWSSSTAAAPPSLQVQWRQTSRRFSVLVLEQTSSRYSNNQILCFFCHDHVATMTFTLNRGRNMNKCYADDTQLCFESKYFSTQRGEVKKKNARETLSDMHQKPPSCLWGAESDNAHVLYTVTTSWGGRLSHFAACIPSLHWQIIQTKRWWYCRKKR